MAQGKLFRHAAASVESGRGEEGSGKGKREDKAVMLAATLS